MVRMASPGLENRREVGFPRVPFTVLVIALAFWAITNNWIADDRRLFEFAHEWALLACVVSLGASVGLYEVGKVQLSRVSLWIGALCLVVAAVLWWQLLIGSQW